MSTSAGTLSGNFRSRLLNLRSAPLRLLSMARQTLHGRLIKIPLELITDEFAFSLGPQGWNYYMALLADYGENPNMPLEATTFFRFFRHARINSIRYLEDVLFFHEPERRRAKHEFQFYLGTYPWGGLTETDTRVGGTPFGWYYDRVAGRSTRDLWGYGKTLWYQPDDKYTIENEWDLTTKQYHSLQHGYHPWLHLSLPTVTMLVRSNGDRRAIIADGHHRLSILGYLGYDQVWVEVLQSVEEAAVDQWHYVKGGGCSRQHALEIFHAFFRLNGRERLLSLNLDEPRSHV
jgi:hypothetical protein